MLYTFGIAITFFLSVILMTKNEKSNADKILAMWLFIIGLHLSLFSLISSEKYLQFPHLLGFEIPIPLLHGPFLFIYTTALTRPHALGKKNFLHFIPFVINFIAISSFFILKPEEKIAVYLQEGGSYAILMDIVFIGIIISGISYSLLSLRAVFQHRKKIQEEFSFTEKINLRWLYYLILGLSVIWVIVPFSNDQYIFSSVVLYVIFIGYFGIKQVGIFTNRYKIDRLASKPSLEPIIETQIHSEILKYGKSALSSDQLDVIGKDLVKLMTHNKLYQNPELTLSDVAQELNIHPNTLSQVINRLEQKNFFDYINNHRVEEFKKNVIKPESQHLTLLSIAYECGFNSKTSFNRNFKKVTGLSPSEYLKKAHITLK